MRKFITFLLLAVTFIFANELQEVEGTRAGYVELKGFEEQENWTVEFRVQKNNIGKVFKIDKTVSYNSRSKQLAEKYKWSCNDTEVENLRGDIERYFTNDVRSFNVINNNCPKEPKWTPNDFIELFPQLHEDWLNFTNTKSKLEKMLDEYLKNRVN